MNNLQYFVRNEKNIHRLIYVLGSDDCEVCPAHSFCLADGKMAEPKYEDCGDAFVAWAMKEKKTRRKTDKPWLETPNI
jgi:hypothetical protein